MKKKKVRKAKYTPSQAKKIQKAMLIKKRKTIMKSKLPTSITELTKMDEDEKEIVENT